MHASTHHLENSLHSLSSLALFDYVNQSQIFHKNYSCLSYAFAVVFSLEYYPFHLSMTFIQMLQSEKRFGILFLTSKGP